jgi:hypothetical protein
VTTISWPVKDAPVTHALWREEFAGQDGITDDTGGDAFKITLPGSGDVATIALGGKYRFRGYTLQVTVAHAVTLAAVSSGSPKTYDVGIKYDPSAEAAAGGPLTVFALETGTYAPSGGTAYVILYKVTRSAAQVLSAAAVADLRTWAAATYYGAAGSHVLSYPVGARLILPSGLELLRVPKVSGGVVVGTQWRSPNSPIWTALTLASGMTRFNTAPSWARVGNEIILRGALQRSNGADLAGAQVPITLATLPAGLSPDYALHTSASVSFVGDSSAGRLSIDPGSLQISFTPESTGCKWVDFCSLRWFLPTSGITYIS